MEIVLANPRGFCAGVDRAIEIVERALELFGAPIYVRHEVVHNRYVVDRLRNLGAVFVDELDQVPDGTTVIFSAHGVPKAVQDEAAARELNVFDATCPLVTKVHMEVSRYAQDGREVVLIGHAGHPEVEGTARVIDALRERFPALLGPRKEDICYATQNRQDAVKSMVKRCDVMLVVGSPESSNSNRLREIAEKAGIHGYLIDGPEDLRREWFEGKRAVGVTAGASAPEILVKQVVDRLREWGGTAAEEVTGRPEKVMFSLPRELRRA